MDRQGMASGQMTEKRYASSVYWRERDKKFKFLTWTNTKDSMIKDIPG